MSKDMKDFINQRTWAVVGVSSDSNKYGYKVYFQLKAAGYNVYAVNPKLDQIKEDQCYPDLTSLPEKPDVISVVVPPKVTEKVISDCIKSGIKRVWMQPGSESDEAIRNGEIHGIDVIYNQCVLIQTRHMI